MNNRWMQSLKLAFLLAVVMTLSSCPRPITFTIVIDNQSNDLRITSLKLTEWPNTFGDLSGELLSVQVRPGKTRRVTVDVAKGEGATAITVYSPEIDATYRSDEFPNGFQEGDEFTVTLTQLGAPSITFVQTI